MARPYLESQAEGAADPQTRKVYQSAVYLMNILDRVPVHVIPCIEGRVETADNFAGASFYGSILPAVWSFMLRPAFTRPRFGVDHAPPGQGGRDRRAARHPRGHHPGRAHPRRLHHRGRLQAGGAPAGGGDHLLGHVGRYPRVTRGAGRESETRCLPSSRASKPPPTAAARSRSSGPPPAGRRRRAGGAERVEWSRLHDDARGIAAALQARGVGPGVHVGILGPTTRALVTTIQATFLAGGTVVALPLPMRLGSIEEFVEQTRRRIANADAGLVVVDPDLAPFLDPPPGGPPAPTPVVLLDALVAEGAQLGADAVARPADDPERLAILQFTSGSTAAAEGRDAARPLRGRQHRRDRRGRGDPPR